MENKQNVIGLETINSNIEQMAEAFMNENPSSFRAAMADRITKECGVDGKCVLDQIMKGVETFRVSFKEQQEGVTLYDRCEARDMKAECCDKRQRMANRNQDIIHAHMLTQAMLGETTDEEAVEALQLNLENAKLSDEEQKEILNELNAKAANLYAAREMKRMMLTMPERREKVANEMKRGREEKNLNRLSISRAAALYIKTTKLAKNELADKPEAAGEAEKTVLDSAETMGFMVAAMTQTEAEADRIAAETLHAAEIAKYDEQVKEAYEAYNEATAAAEEEAHREMMASRSKDHKADTVRKVIAEKEHKLKNIDDGQPEISGLQFILTAIGSVVTGHMVANFVFNTVGKAILAAVAGVETTSLVTGVIGILLSAVGGSYLILAILAIVFVCVAVGTFVGVNALIQKIRELQPEVKQRMMKAAQENESLSAEIKNLEKELNRLKIEEANETKKIHQSKLEAAQNALKEKLAAAEAPDWLAKAEEEAREALSKSRKTIKERMLAPCRKAAAFLKEKVSAGAQALASAVSVKQKEAEKN